MNPSFDQKTILALGHPLRVEILQLLEEGPSGPKRMSDRLGEKLSNVSYHVRVLHKCGCIELLETLPQRGAVEHIYQLDPQGIAWPQSWRVVPPALGTRYAETALAAFTTRAVDALDAGTAETREGSGITWLPLDVDKEGWKEMREVLSNVEKRFRAVADKSAERMENPRDGIPVIVAVAAFEVASGKDAEPS